MTRYIALIRGINVGGNNKVAMPELRAAFAAAGFSHVVTYINSGNVIFDSDETDLATLIARCETVLRDTFAVTTKISVLSADELHDAAAHVPDWWGEDPASKHNAIFVIAPADAQAIAGEVGDIKPEYEQVALYGHVIFWSAPLDTFGRTRWSKIVGSASYDKITIRNANTFRKLLDLSR